MIYVFGVLNTLKKCSYQSPLYCLRSSCFMPNPLQCLPGYMFFLCVGFYTDGKAMIDLSGLTR